MIEDVAQAIGADYTFSNGDKKKAGTIGTVGCTSFFPSKNLGCYGDGGAIYTNDDDLAKKLRMVAHHGQSVQYVHDVLGVNSRLDTIQAVVLKAKLKHLDEYAAARNKAADYYDKALANHPKIKTPVRVKNSTHVFHQYTMILNEVNRDEVKQRLQDRGIPSMIYYPIPAHQQKMFESFGIEAGDLETTNWLASHVLSIPIHTEMTDEQMGYITTTLIEIINSL